MTRVRRLEQLAELTAREEKQVAKHLADVGRRLQESEAQLQSLCRFRTEYAERYQQEQGAISALRLGELRAFLSNLGRAIEEQEAALQQLRQEYAALEQRWQRVYCRHRGIGKVHADLRRREQVARERRIQVELDDRAAIKRQKRD
ncbi:MAG: hypothetical protein Kow0060_13100 [Methylohalobius crimeensis]